jgi:polysaccharide biosynthesis/export protein
MGHRRGGPAGLRPARGNLGRRGGIWATHLVVACVAAISAHASEYRVQTGDVLELAIIGNPDIRHRIPVGLSGEASFPLIGEMQVAGRGISELRASVSERLSRQIFKNRNSGGSDVVQTIEAHEVSLRILEYRPVYLIGDVARAGEVAYRPGLTVRQAIAVAGGYGLLQSGGARSLLDLAESQSQYATLAVTWARERARVWRVENSLGKEAPVETSELPIGVTRDLIDGMIKLEAEVMAVQQSDYDTQKTHLASAIKQADERIVGLVAQAKSEDEGAKLDAADMERVNELFRKGVVPASRVTEVRRSALLASSRALQTSSAAENVRSDREDLRTKLDRLDDTRRLELVRELSDANAKLEAAKSQLEGARLKMLAADGARAGFLREFGSNLRVMVSRKVNNETTRIVAEEDLDLLPGDVVEVSLGAANVGTEGTASSNSAGPRGE